MARTCIQPRQGRGQTFFLKMRGGNGGSNWRHSIDPCTKCHIISGAQRELGFWLGAQAPNPQPLSGYAPEQMWFCACASWKKALMCVNKCFLYDLELVVTSGQSRARLLCMPADISILRGWMHALWNYVFTLHFVLTTHWMKQRCSCLHCVSMKCGNID